MKTNLNPNRISSEDIMGYLEESMDWTIPFAVHIASLNGLSVYCPSHKKPILQLFYDLAVGNRPFHPDWLKDKPIQWLLDRKYPNMSPLEGAMKLAKAIASAVI